MARNVYALLCYTIQDRFGTRAQVQFPFTFDGSVVTLDDFTTQAIGTGNDLDGITDGQIVGVRLIVDLPPDPDWKSSPESTSFVERTANFAFLNLVTKYLFNLAVPSISPSEISSSGKITGGAVDTFLDNLENQSATQGFTDKQQHEQEGVAHSMLSIRKKRRQLDKSTYEL